MDPVIQHPRRRRPIRASTLVPRRTGLWFAVAAAVTVGASVILSVILDALRRPSHATSPSSLLVAALLTVLPVGYALAFGLGLDRIRPEEGFRWVCLGLVVLGLLHLLNLCVLGALAASMAAGALSRVGFWGGVSEFALVAAAYATLVGAPLVAVLLLAWAERALMLFIDAMLGAAISIWMALAVANALGRAMSRATYPR